MQEARSADRPKGPLVTAPPDESAVEPLADDSSGAEPEDVMTASGAGPESAGAERSNEIIDGLERLADMYQQGLLTDEEFAEAKSRLLLRRDPSS